MDAEFWLPLSDVRQSLFRAKIALGDWMAPTSPNFTLDDLSIDDSLVNLSDQSHNEDLDLIP